MTRFDCSFLDYLVDMLENSVLDLALPANERNNTGLHLPFSQVPLESNKPVKESHSESELPDDSPWMQMDYLNEEEPPLSDDGSKAWLADRSNDNRNIRSLRLWWLQGRLLSAYRCLVGAESSGSQTLRPTDICQMLDVSPQAVSQWTQGTSVIAAENLELLERYFPKAKADAKQPTQYQLDCSGYRFAMTVLKRKATNDRTIELVDEITFWILWFLFQSEAWLAAESTEDFHVAAQGVVDQLNAVVALLPELSDCDLRAADVDGMHQIMRSWGMTYLQVVSQLDDVCWTTPDV